MLDYCGDETVYMMVEGMADEGVVRRCNLMVCRNCYVGEEMQHMRYWKPGM